jgi:predicted porin
MRNTLWLVGLLSILFLFFNQNVFAQDEELLKKLEQIIQNQQKQIDSQAAALSKMKKRLDAFTREKESSSKNQTEIAKVSAPTISSGNKNTSLKIYGHINRAILAVDDGDSGNVYQVDNSNSMSRLGFRGTKNLNKDLKIGTLIEAGFQANPSTSVDQENARGVGVDGFRRRHTDLYLDHKTMGKLSIGHGSTASDGSSEVDLSGTFVIGYSSINYMAGGQLFHDRNNDKLSATKINDVFKNMDGGRDSRIRYDTPSYSGIIGSASYIADGGGDIVARYANNFDSFKISSAIAYQNPGSASASVDDRFSGSASILLPCGFNATAASGVQGFKATGKGDARFRYLKLGFQHKFFDVGRSNISMDYGQYDDINLDGDQADTFGIQFVQNFSEWATEYYLGYRFHKLDRDLENYDDINAIMSGLRVKF